MGPTVAINHIISLGVLVHWLLIVVPAGVVVQDVRVTYSYILLSLRAVLHPADDVAYKDVITPNCDHRIDQQGHHATAAAA